MQNIFGRDVIYQPPVRHSPVVVGVVQFNVLCEIDVDVALDGDGHDVTVGQGDLDGVVPANQVSCRIRDDNALRRRREVVLLVRQDLEAIQTNLRHSKMTSFYQWVGL